MDVSSDIAAVWKSLAAAIVLLGLIAPEPRLVRRA